MDSPNQESVRFLLVHGHPMLDVQEHPRGEFTLRGLGDIWLEESPQVGYGVVMGQPLGKRTQRFEFLLGDRESLQWAVAAAVAHLEHPNEPLAEASPMTRP